MRKLPLIFFLTCASITLSADETEPKQKQTPKHFESFTGKINGNNVRMRLQPSLDAPVYKELDRDDFVLVTGLVDDFYACMPPKGLKGYIFRTYVLDGVVEGSNVYVRLGPDRTAPSIAQLNSGDTVKGVISSQNSKWLEIELPEEVRFYVAKDYVKQAGDASYFQRFQSRKSDVQKSLNEIECDLDRELAKPFPKIQLAPINTRLSELISQNKDMPQAVSQAEALMSRMQESYLAKSVAHACDTTTFDADMQAPKEVADGELTPAPQAPAQSEPENRKPQTPVPPPAKPLSAFTWQNREDDIVLAALKQGKASSGEDFYKKELANANTLHGIIKPYSSFVSARPGDFVLMNMKTNLPIAYLYSTKVDLASHCNKPIAIWVSERPNNNFAFPAYFVLQIEE